MLILLGSICVLYLPPELSVPLMQSCVPKLQALTVYIITSQDFGRIAAIKAFIVSILYNAGGCYANKIYNNPDAAARRTV